MPPMYIYMLCGLTAGLLGGYLGLGGGVIMVPFLTIAAGLDIKTAVPVSVTATVVTSIASSNAYLKKGMVDIELSLILALFMVIGTITGSSLSPYIPSHYIQLVLTIVVIYTAVSLLKKNNQPSELNIDRNKNMVLSAGIAIFTGILSGLVGIGGGVIIVPVLYLLIGLPLSTARGTSSLMIGFSAAAASTVYLLNDQIDFQVLIGVVLGIIIGGKIGGKLGAVAKPKIVRIIFFLVLLYIAVKLGYESITEIL